MERGTICFTTIASVGLGHDQGTRPVLVIGRTDLADVTGETLVLPISHVEPPWTYPLSWQVPGSLLPRASWVLIGRPQAQLVARLRDPLVVLDGEQMDEVVGGLRQLVEA